MKRRRVIVSLELETNVPLSDLRGSGSWEDWLWLANAGRGSKVLQAQANRVGKSIGNPVFPRRKKKPARRA